MASYLESSPSPSEPAKKTEPSGWLKVGVVAAASALAGGLAAAWFYRKTLARLRQAEVQSADFEFRIPEDDPLEDD
jgi:hypothetical protein